VDLAGHQLLAGAVLPEDQDARVARRALLDQFADPLDARRGAGHAVLLGQPRLQGAVLPLQLFQPQGVLHHGDGLFQRQGLFQEVEGAQLHRLHRQVDVAVAGDHHHLDFGVFGLDALEHLDAAHVRQPDVQDDQLHRLLGEQAQGLEAVLGQDHPVAFVPQAVGEHLADALLVVHDQDHAHSFQAPNGRSMMKVVPTPAWVSKRIEPPWSKTIRSTMVSPSPAPCFLVVK
jgi:hypothetical protein